MGCYVAYSSVPTGRIKGCCNQVPATQVAGYYQMSPTGHPHRQPAQPARSKIVFWNALYAPSGSFHNCILERTCAPSGSFHNCILERTCTRNCILERTCTRNCISHPCNTTGAMPLAPALVWFGRLGGGKVKGKGPRLYTPSPGRGNPISRASA
jgi:hypothetical protein